MNDNNPVQPTLLRLKHIIGDKTHPPIIPLSRSVVAGRKGRQIPLTYQDWGEYHCVAFR